MEITILLEGYGLWVSLGDQVQKALYEGFTEFELVFSSKSIFYFFYFLIHEKEQRGYHHSTCKLTRKRLGCRLA